MRQRHSNHEVAATTYGKAGKELASFSSRTQGTISRTTYRQIEQSGYRVDEKIVVPVDAAFLRLAVMERLTDRVGSMEVSLPLKSRALQ